MIPDKPGLWWWQGLPNRKPVPLMVAETTGPGRQSLVMIPKAVYASVQGIWFVPLRTIESMGGVWLGPVAPPERSEP